LREDERMLEEIRGDEKQREAMRENEKERRGGIFVITGRRANEIKIERLQTVTIKRLAPRRPQRARGGWLWMESVGGRQPR